MKSNIVKNPLWDKKKPTKEFKNWYQKTYGLVVKEVYLANDKFYDLYEKILTGMFGK